MNKIKTVKKTTTKTESKKVKKSRNFANTAVEMTKKFPGEVARQMSPFISPIFLPQRAVRQIADEVAKRLRRKPNNKKSVKPKIENPIFLDTSAIIDERLFELIKLGVFYGNFVVLDSILSEIKNIADSRDDVKKERGRRALKKLDEIKKQKNVKLINLSDQEENIPVDDKIIQFAKRYKGRLLTCDYNLYKKARIENVAAIDIHEIANILKTTAVPGETFWVKIVQLGKGKEQGVGYLPDGTMIVLENGEQYMEKTVQVVVSRIIQTEAGRILFAKTKEEI